LVSTRFSARSPKVLPALRLLHLRQSLLRPPPHRHLPQP
jgi:hypothetical protein